MRQSDDKETNPMAWSGRPSPTHQSIIVSFLSYRTHTCLFSSDEISWVLCLFHPFLPTLMNGFNKTKAFTIMSTQVASGDTSMLAEMHATTSGLKILVTTTGIQDVEIARRSMGGHGYSAFAGLGRIYAEYLPSASCVQNSYSVVLDYWQTWLPDTKVTITFLTNK